MLHYYKERVYSVADYKIAYCVAKPCVVGSLARFCLLVIIIGSVTCMLHATVNLESY